MRDTQLHSAASHDGVVRKTFPVFTPRWIRDMAGTVERLIRTISATTDDPSRYPHHCDLTRWVKTRMQSARAVSPDHNTPYFAFQRAPENVGRHLAETRQGGAGL